MTDPGKDKKKRKKIEHGKLIFELQQKQQQNIGKLIFRPQQKQQQNI
jgi:hypothetical protein